MPSLLSNWRTTVMALLPFAAYGLKAADLWPESMPLPPLDQVWPALFAALGVGIAASDARKG